MAMNSLARNRKHPVPAGVLAAALLCWAPLPPARAQSPELVVGQSLALSGPAASLASALQQGAQACIDHVNAGGGVHGRRLRLVVRDDRGDPGRALDNAADLVQKDKAVVLLGSMGTAAGSALSSWAARLPVAVIGPHSGSPALRGPEADTTFFVRPTYSAETQKLAAHLRSTAVDKVVVVYVDDALGRETLVGVEEALSVEGVRPLAVLGLARDGGNMADTVERIVRAAPQGVMLATSGQATVMLVRALARARAEGALPFQLYGLSFSVTQSELQALGPDARNLILSQVVPSPDDRRSPLALRYQEAVRQNAALQRSHAGMEGCIGPLLLAEVLQRGNGRDLTPAGIVKALRSAGAVKLGGFEVELSSRERPGSRFVDIVTVGTDGRILR